MFVAIYELKELWLLAGAKGNEALLRYYNRKIKERKSRMIFEVRIVNEREGRCRPLFCHFGGFNLKNLV